MYLFMKQLYLVLSFLLVALHVDAQIINIPDAAFIAATITLGVPAGGHGPVRRKPLDQLVFEDEWDAAPSWAVDPVGTRFTGGPKGN